MDISRPDLPATEQQELCAETGKTNVRAAKGMIGTDFDCDLTKCDMLQVYCGDFTSDEMLVIERFYSRVFTLEKQTPLDIFMHVVMQNIDNAEDILSESFLEETIDED